MSCALPQIDLPNGSFGSWLFRADNFEQIASIPVGKLPHGVWPSGDGTQVYVGLENEDKVAAIDTLKNEVIATSPIGQAPQALVYVPDAVPAAPHSKRSYDRTLSRCATSRRASNIRPSAAGLQRAPAATSPRSIRTSTISSSRCAPLPREA